MARNFDALKERRENDKFSATLKGKIFNWGGRLFAIYCIFRVISVSHRIILKRYLFRDLTVTYIVRDQCPNARPKPSIRQQLS
jgi:hypothetical protein